MANPTDPTDNYLPKPDTDPPQPGKRKLMFLLSRKPEETLKQFQARAVEAARLNGMFASSRPRDPDAP